MRKTILSILLLSVSTITFSADEVVAPPKDESLNTGFVKQIDKSIEQDIKLDERLKRAEKLQQIYKLENEMAKVMPGINPSTYGTPYVKAVEGMNKKYTSLIIFVNGVEYESSVGDYLPNGMKVTRVAPGDVRVKDKNKEYRLGFVDPTQLMQMQNTNGVSGSSMPGMMR